MRIRIAPWLLGGLLGLLYTGLSIGGSFLLGGDSEGIFILLYITNIHITYFFSIVGPYLPETLFNDVVFALLTASIFNFLIGSVIVQGAAGLWRKIRPSPTS